jgi:hypothetical protein
LLASWGHRENRMALDDAPTFRRRATRSATRPLAGSRRPASTGSGRSPRPAYSRTASERQSRPLYAHLRVGRRPAGRGRVPLAAAPSAMRSRAPLRTSDCSWCGRATMSAPILATSASRTRTNGATRSVTRRPACSLPDELCGSVPPAGQRRPGVRPRPGDPGDSLVAIGVVRSESTQIVKALAREPPALPDYAWRGSPGVDAVVTALVLAASRGSVS